MSLRPTPVRVVLRAAALTCLTLYTPLLLPDVLCFFGLGGWRTVGREFLLLAAVIGGPVGLLVGLASLGVRNVRWPATQLIAMSVAVLLLLVPSVFVSATLRHHGFVRAARRAEPLVAALHAYEARHGHPPGRLAEVVDVHADAAPSRLPPLELVTGPDARLYGGNSWVLVAQVGRGFMNFDSFLYFPNQQYPAHGFGGSIERIGTWGYVHE